MLPPFHALPKDILEINQKERYLAIASKKSSVERKIEYTNSPLLHRLPTINYDCGAPVDNVPQSQMAGALGLYFTFGQRINIAEGQSSEDNSYVNAHEGGHGRGMNEQHADAYAMSRTGHYKRTLLHPYYLGYEI